MSKRQVHEVAKDFGAATKEITEILTQYCTTPKNHMQVLSDQEPVSYTHLDVYKRQLRDRVPAARLRSARCRPRGLRSP